MVQIKGWCNVGRGGGVVDVVRWERGWCGEGWGFSVVRRWRGVDVVRG